MNSKSIRNFNDETNEKLISSTNNLYYYDVHKNYELTLSKDKFIRKGLCGLVNLGNKCFMISVLQCLFSTLKLTDYFLSRQFLEDDPDKTNSKKKEYYIILSYVQLLINVWESNQLLKPKSFTENLSKFVNKYFTLEQQDSHECLLYILDLMHKGLSYEIEVEINGNIKTHTDLLMRKSLESWQKFYEKSYSYITELFNGLTHNNIKCNSCNLSDDIFEPFNCFSIDIPNNTDSLTNCLNNYFKDTDSINGWNCEKCKNSGCNKNTKIWSLPNYLIIQLKRFTNNGQKNNNYIEFPIENLNLTPYISNDKNDPNNYIYSLYAVNYHSGSLNSGHYWSSCKNLDENWYLFNDGNVNKINNVTEILTKDAYILFYYRKFIKNPIQV